MADDPSSGDERRGRAQRTRSIVIALALAALVIIFYLATIVRLGGGVASRAF